MTEEQAEKLFAYISKKVKDITKTLHIAIIQYPDSIKNSYSLVVVRDGDTIDEHMGFIGAYNNGLWERFVDFKYNKNDEKRHMYQKIIIKLLEICKDYDVAIPWYHHDKPILIRKGTTLHQLLIEADFMS